jgi:hypothetical protein
MLSPVWPEDAPAEEPTRVAASRRRRATASSSKRSAEGSSPTFAVLVPPSRPALPHPPPPQLGRLLPRSGPRSLTLHPLHLRLDREPAAALGHWGPGALDAEPSPSPPRPRRSRPTAGAHGGGRTALTPAAPAEVALIVPMRCAIIWSSFRMPSTWSTWRLSLGQQPMGLDGGRRAQHPTHPHRHRTDASGRG